MTSRPPIRASPTSNDVAARQIGSLARAFGRLEDRRNLVAHTIGITAMLLVAPVIATRRPGAAELVGWLALAIGAYGTLTTGAIQLFRPPRVRLAFESFLWIGGWEYRRTISTLGVRRLPKSPEALRRLLAEHPPPPDLAAIRIESLVWNGDFAAAAEVAERLPDDTPWQRFEKELHRDLVGFVAFGELGLEAAQAAAYELRGEERLRAEALLAVEGARHRVAANDPDWIAPLVDVRPRIGPPANGLVLRVLVPKVLVANLAVGACAGLAAFVFAGAIDV